MKHFTSVYLIKQANGKMASVSYRPSDPYVGQSDRDQYALRQCVRLLEPSHDYEVGGRVELVQEVHYANDLHPIYFDGTVCAKQTYDWDYTQPMGFEFRAQNVIEEGDFKGAMKLYMEEYRQAFIQKSKR